MDVKSKYFQQVKLLMKILPIVSQEVRFALKGGTAINMFYQDMPRLSVDIDLSWLPTEDRNTSLKNIVSALQNTADLISKSPNGIDAKYNKSRRTGLNQVYIFRDEIDIKIDISTITRGTVLPTQVLPTSKSASETFQFIEMKVVSFEDLYAGKLCAAMERKHPRDLFDVMVLYDNEGLSDKLFRVYMVYVACSKRPMHESLNPSGTVREEWYNDDFEGMSLIDVSLPKLVETAQRLHEDVSSRLTGPIAEFLLSLHDAEPDFGLLGFPEAIHLSGVQWKLLNLRKLIQQNPKKHAEQRNALEQLFM